MLKAKSALSRSANKPRKLHSTPHKSATFRSTTPPLSKKFGDTWTQQAKALGYPSRAVFKLMQAQKKHRIIHPGDVVVDLGCSPGSWSKLSSTIAGGQGFVLGMDLTTLSPHEQANMGVRPNDINQRFEHPKTYDDGSSKSMLSTERKVFKSKSPVGYMNQDVTQWSPGPGFIHNTDVILSDMAPNTTGVPSQDSAESIELCFSVIDLCSKLFKPPSTKLTQFTGQKEREIALQQLKNNPSNENVLVSHLQSQFNKNMEKRYGTDSSSVILTNSSNVDNEVDTDDLPDNQTQQQRLTAGTLLHHIDNKANLRIVKKTLKQHAYLQKHNATGILDGEVDSAIYKTDERTLSQIKDNEQYSTRWNGTLMMKVFQGEGIAELIDILKQIFVSTFTFKPESSRSESVEIFLICKGYCGPFENTRITNKHVRRPKTEEYLRSYVSNNKKRPPVPHDPTKSPRFDRQILGNPRSYQYDPKTIHQMKTADIKGLSVSDLYKKLGYDQNSVSFTSDEFKKQEEEKKEIEHFHQAIHQTIQSGVTTNVHAAIKNTSSLDPGAMSPLQREISESDDIVVYQQRQFDELYGNSRASVNKVPSVEALMKSMSLYWDEGINYAKRMAVESQTPARIDIFQGRKATVFDDIKRDDLGVLVDDAERSISAAITAESIMQEYHKQPAVNRAQTTRKTAIAEEDKMELPVGAKTTAKTSLKKAVADKTRPVAELLSVHIPVAAKKGAQKKAATVEQQQQQQSVEPIEAVIEKPKRGRKAAAPVEQVQVEPVVEQPSSVKKSTKEAKKAVKGAVEEVLIPVESKKVSKKGPKAVIEPIIETPPVIEPTKGKRTSKKSPAVEPEPVVEQASATKLTAKGRSKKVIAVEPIVQVAVETAIPVKKVPKKAAKSSSSIVAEPVSEGPVSKPTTRGRPKKAVVE